MLFLTSKKISLCSRRLSPSARRMQRNTASHIYVPTAAKNGQVKKCFCACFACPPRLRSIKIHFHAPRRGMPHQTASLPHSQPIPHSCLELPTAHHQTCPITTCHSSCQYQPPHSPSPSCQQSRTPWAHPTKPATHSPPPPAAQNHTPAHRPLSTPQPTVEPEALPLPARTGPVRGYALGLEFTVSPAHRTAPTTQPTRQYGNLHPSHPLGDTALAPFCKETPH